jgi:lysophospholipase L1-like esterase
MSYTASNPIESLMTSQIKLLLFGALALGSAAVSAETAAPLNPAPPTLFVAGDSTAAPGPTPDQQGWGEPLADYFVASKINVANRARGGRSSRTFVTEGHWEQLLMELKPGDFVLLQFGHNDAGALNEEPPGSTRPLRARGTIPGVGEEAEEIDNVITGQHEVVHSFGWYLRKMIADVREKHATPILLSLTVRNIWNDGRVECGADNYRQWDIQIAKSNKVALIDVTRIIADRYQAMGSEAVKDFFPKDHIHTNPAGADFNAAAVVAGLKAMKAKPFARLLSAKGRAVRKDRGRFWRSVCERLGANTVGWAESSKPNTLS